MQETGEELVGLIGEPDKPEVERSIEDVDTALQALNDACDTRQRALDDALRRATCFHDELGVSIQLYLCSCHTITPPQRKDTVDEMCYVFDVIETPVSICMHCDTVLHV